MGERGSCDGIDIASLPDYRRLKDASGRGKGCAFVTLLETVHCMVRGLPLRLSEENLETTLRLLQEEGVGDGGRSHE